MYIHRCLYYIFLFFNFLSSCRAAKRIAGRRNFAGRRNLQVAHHLFQETPPPRFYYPARQKK
ncbi:MAG: hypothetical protein II849_04385, partial [Bacteroidales bacterium]|nr:hypothetical protein [Bacteroidales bacterium]